MVSGVVPNEASDRLIIFQVRLLTTVFLCICVSFVKILFRKLIFPGCAFRTVSMLYGENTSRIPEEKSCLASQSRSIPD